MFHSKQTVPTSTRTYLCVMGVCGARSAVFVCTGRVLSITSQATRNLFVLEVSTGTVTCCFNSLFTGLVPCWFECSTQNKPYQQVCARTRVSCACVTHGLQCLCVRGACCSSLPKQLVIFSFLRFPPAPRLVVSTRCSLGCTVLV